MRRLPSAMIFQEDAEGGCGFCVWFSPLVCANLLRHGIDGGAAPSLRSESSAKIRRGLPLWRGGDGLPVPTRSGTGSTEAWLRRYVANLPRRFDGGCRFGEAATGFPCQPAPARDRRRRGSVATGRIPPLSSADGVPIDRARESRCESLLRTPSAPGHRERRALRANKHRW